MGASSNVKQSTYILKQSLPPKEANSSSAKGVCMCVGEILPLHVGMVTVIVLCRSCVGSHSHYDLMSATTLLYPIKHCFTGVLPQLWLLHAFSPLFHDAPEPWGRRVM